MNAAHYHKSLNVRSVLTSLIWAGIGSMVLSGCGSGVDTRIPVAGSASPSLQSESGAAGSVPRGSRTNFEVTAITHLMTIESDVAGRATLPVLFNVELLVDSNNSVQMLNVHRQGTTRPALPSSGMVHASDRAQICAENSAASQENCDVDLPQLMRDGVVVERFLGRAGVILRAENGFSATTGGRLTLHYIQRANLNESAQDVMADFPIELEHVNSQWLAVAGNYPDRGAFTLMKLASNFSGLFATGVKSIQVGTSDTNLW